jgi:hypothetical protein
LIFGVSQDHLHIQIKWVAVDTEQTLAQATFYDLIDPPNAARIYWSPTGERVYVSWGFMLVVFHQDGAIEVNNYAYYDRYEIPARFEGGKLFYPDPPLASSATPCSFRTSKAGGDRDRGSAGPTRQSLRPELESHPDSCADLARPVPG